MSNLALLGSSLMGGTYNIEIMPMIQVRGPLSHSLFLQGLLMGISLSYNSSIASKASIMSEEGSSYVLTSLSARCFTA